MLWLKNLTSEMSKCLKRCSFQKGSFVAEADRKFNYPRRFWLLNFPVQLGFVCSDFRHRKIPLRTKTLHLCNMCLGTTERQQLARSDEVPEYKETKKFRSLGVKAVAGIPLRS